MYRYVCLHKHEIPPGQHVETELPSRRETEKKKKRKKGNWVAGVRGGGGLVIVHLSVPFEF